MRACKIFSILCGPVKCSFRKIAKLTGISKSSAHRHAQSIKSRNRFPESHLWETEEGLYWLKLLFFGAIIFFGVQCGIGSEKLSTFFKFLRLNKHIGISPSAIKKYCERACELLDKYRQEQEEKHKLETSLKIVGGIDETYFNTMILVLMDLASGYIFIEEESGDKSYETWLEKAKKVADKFNIKFKFFVSDRAKQLIKLATQGFKSSSIPDLFHASHELVKLFGLNLNRKKDEIKKKLAKEIVTLAILQGLSKDISTQKAIIKGLECQQTLIDKGLWAYHDMLHKLSLIVHPFDIKDSSGNSSATVEVLLNIILKEAENLKKAHDISSKKDHLEKFKKQIKEMASLIDIWWSWVDERLQDDAIDKNFQLWLKEYLLPLIYWQNQAARTKHSDLKQEYTYAADKAQAKFDELPLTQQLIQNEEMVCWAKWMVSNFQRTSSAVEGRNGWLSQMHHNGRGLSSKRLKAQTILHNFYLKRCDGSTAAERLFRQKFPDPLEWVVNRMGDLPQPRNLNGKCAVNI